MSLSRTNRALQYPEIGGSAGQRRRDEGNREKNNEEEEKNQKKDVGKENGEEQIGLGANN